MKNTRLLPIALALVAALLLVTLVLAAIGGMPRSLAGSGGGLLEGGGLSLRSALGQPLAGTVSDGIQLCSGFHCGSGVVDTPSNPAHAIYLPVVVR